MLIHLPLIYDEHDKIRSTYPYITSLASSYGRYFSFFFFLKGMFQLC
jgi:hypothetical protein